MDSDQLIPVNVQSDIMGGSSGTVANSNDCEVRTYVNTCT